MSSRHSTSNEKLVSGGEATCALCNCGDKCLLGQGDLLRFDVPDGGLLGVLKLVQLRYHQQAAAGPGRNENERFLANCLVGYLESLASSDEYWAVYLNKNANLANLFK